MALTWVLVVLEIRYSIGGVGGAELRAAQQDGQDLGLQAASRFREMQSCTSSLTWIFPASQ
jgi:hypothetical protein